MTNVLSTISERTENLSSMVSKPLNSLKEAVGSFNGRKVIHVDVEDADFRAGAEDKMLSGLAKFIAVVAIISFGLIASASAGAAVVLIGGATLLKGAVTAGGTLLIYFSTVYLGGVLVTRRANWPKDLI